MESSGIVTDGQRTRYRAVIVTDDGIKVRHTISLDRSYHFQSSAISEVWSPQMMQWNRIAYLLWGEWATAGNPALVIELAVEKLEEQVMLALG